MKGYKALDMDMRAVFGNGMQYEMGKEYVIEGEVILCENGFHFCESIEEVNAYYSIKDSRIFEVEAGGKILKKDVKYAAEKIKIIRELTKEEIKDYFKRNIKAFIQSLQCYVRAAAAEQGYCLDVLVNDINCSVRCAVAEQGYGLDKLVKDEDWYVRTVVAKQGYGLDVLIHDEYWQVRYEVAKRGFGLNILINDEDRFVKETAQKIIKNN